MNLILLSGGSGKRLWPLSNDVRSKQFLKLFPGEDGKYESMLQRMYRGIRRVDPSADITIATAASQVSSIRNQLTELPAISVEPCRRDTFPAIALAASYIVDVRGIAPGDSVLICPVDPFVEDDYFEALLRLDTHLKESGANMVLMGVEPTYPSEKYGYIIPESKDPVSNVRAFREKPDAVTAKQFMEEGALWNAGIFACRLDYILRKAREIFGYCDYNSLYQNYSTLKPISFDYAVVECESNLRVVRFCGHWKDLGTWNTLTEAMEDRLIGNAISDETCRDLHIINELDVPILAMGLKNIVISASPEGILVSDKHQSSYIKPFVDKIQGQTMFAEKSWGSYRVIDVEPTGLTVKVTLNPGHFMNYHSHERREESWTILSGEGFAIIDGVRTAVCPGMRLSMPAGSKHTIYAQTELKLIEVQLGTEIRVEDKICHENPITD